MEEDIKVHITSKRYKKISDADVRFRVLPFKQKICKVE